MSDFINQNYALASVIVLLTFILMAFSPFLIPLIYALRKGSALPRRILFVFTTCAQSFGIILFCCMAIFLTMELYKEFYGPRIDSSGFLYNDKVLQFIDLVQAYWWLLTVFFLPPIAFLITRKIGRRWVKICQAIDG